MWHIALPAIVTNISIPLLGLVDSFMMGHLPDPRYLGAIALGAMIISIMYMSMNFLRMSTTGFTAQAHGRKDKPAIPKIYLRSSLCAVAIGFAFIVMQWPVVELTFSLTGADPAVEALAREYFLIRIRVGHIGFLGEFLGQAVNDRLTLAAKHPQQQPQSPHILTAQAIFLAQAKFLDRFQGHFSDVDPLDVKMRQAIIIQGIGFISGRCRET